MRSSGGSTSWRTGPGTAPVCRAAGLRPRYADDGGPGPNCANIRPRTVGLELHQFRARCRGVGRASLHESVARLPVLPESASKRRLRRMNSRPTLRGLLIARFDPCAGHSEGPIDRLFRFINRGSASEHFRANRGDSEPREQPCRPNSCLERSAERSGERLDSSVALQGLVFGKKLAGLRPRNAPAAAGRAHDAGRARPRYAPAAAGRAHDAGRRQELWCRYFRVIW